MLEGGCDGMICGGTVIAAQMQMRASWDVRLVRIVAIVQNQSLLTTPEVTATQVTTSTRELTHSSFFTLLKHRIF